MVFLGTGATLPSKERNVSSTAVLLDGSVLLFDCGEGTQRQMMLAGVSYMKIDWIALTHFHGDHILGIPGLLQSMSLSNRKRKLVFFGPEGTVPFLNYLREGGLIHSSFPVAAVEMKNGSTFEIGGYRLTAADAKHSAKTLSFRLEGAQRPGRFYPGKAIRLGIRPGPQFGVLQRSGTVRVSERVVRPQDVMGRPRPGPSVGYAIDTRPNSKITALMQNVDVLIFDSTFSAEMIRRARETGHSTCVEAAKVAAQSGAGRLYLDHISARYEDTAQLLREARSVFPNSFVARDFMRHRIKPKG